MSAIGWVGSSWSMVPLDRHQSVILEWKVGEKKMEGLMLETIEAHGVSERMGGGTKKMTTRRSSTAQTSK